MKVTMTSSGSFKNTTNWLLKVSGSQTNAILTRIGQAGVAALSRGTPRRTGATASGWAFKINKTSSGSEVIFYNNAHPETSVNVAKLIQYGHGTRNGGYVPGIDYINPALKSVFATGIDQLFREVD